MIARNGRTVGDRPVEERDAVLVAVSGSASNTACHVGWATKSAGTLVDGADSVSIDGRGRLVVDQSTGPTLRFSAPVSYQIDVERYVPIESRYVLHDDGTIGFELGEYDTALPLVIDPTLELSTYVGDTGDEGLKDVAVDSSGNIVVVGESTSANYPTTAGRYDTTSNGSEDIVVSKFDPTGTTLLWSTFVGGSGADYGREVAIAGDGTVVVVGNTASSDFPTAVGAYDTSRAAQTDAVIFRLGADGTTLDASTFLGSTGSDDAESVELDSSGNVVVLGNTTSSGFPTTAGVYDTTHNGGADTFVAKLTADLTALTWSTFVGGSGAEAAGMVDLDGSDGVWLAAATESSNMPTSAGAFDTALTGTDDSWVGGLSSNGTTLTYGTYIGGTGAEFGPTSIHAVDNTEIHAAMSATPGFPTTTGAYDETTTGDDTGYVVLDTTATGAAQLTYGSLLGGTEGGWAHDLTVDSSGRAYIAGDASVSGLATTGAPDTAVNGAWDGLLAVMDPSTGTLEFLTYAGGNGNVELATGVALTAAGEIVLVGFTDSTDFATTAGAYQTSSGGSVDGFVQKFSALPGSGPVGRWRLDEGSGTTALDSSGNGNDGTLVNGPSYLAGVSSTGLSFAGDSGEGVEIPDPTDDLLDPGSGDFAVETWMRVSAAPANGISHPLVTKLDFQDDPSIDGFELAVYGDGGAGRLFFKIWDDAPGNQASGVWQAFDGSNDWADGQWHHVVGQLDGSDIELWVDGTMVTSSTHSAGTVIADNPLRFGVDQYAINDYDGDLDEISIYRSALSSTEIADAAAAAPCSDSDSDGLCDNEEDANTDVDNDPATNPGPDTDGDLTPNYLDNDDDGDVTPTAAENADPNGDGDPRDAVDTDRDGQPDYLDSPTSVTGGTVTAEQKISDTAGSFTATLDDNDAFGRSVTAVGDLNGDGVVDMVASADSDDDGGTNRGAVYVLFMNADGTVGTHQKISDTVGGFTATLDDSDQFGISVSVLGDVDGDGHSDLVVGAAYDDDGGTDRGAAYVLFLNSDGTVGGNQKISDTVGGFATALDDSDRFGYSVSGIGDLDGDGVVDLVIGAAGDDDGGSDRGAAYVLLLNSDGTVKAEQKISDTAGGFVSALDNSDRFGASVTGIGDLDGDGVFDVAVGADQDGDGGSWRGAVYVLFLNADGTVKSEQKISDLTGGLAAVLDNDDGFGKDVSGVGDLDQDGVLDLVVGAQGDDDGGANRGAVYVLYMNVDGTVKSEQKISNDVGGLTGPVGSSDYFGTSVSGIGDLDGDGTIGLVVGARGDDDGAASGNRGAAYVLNLSLAASIVDAFSDSESADSAAATILDVAANDVDADGDAITAVDATDPSNGTTSTNGDGTVTYTSDPAYTGADAFEYWAIDTGSAMSHYWGLDGDGVDGFGASDGVLTGTTTVTGAFGGALSFDEIDDRVTVPDFAYTSDFTLSFDFKLDDNSGSLFQYAYSHGDVNGTDSINVFLLEASHGTDPNTLRTVVRDGDDTLDNVALEVDIASLVGDGLWHTYTLVADQSAGLTVYLDGSVANTDPIRGTGGVNPTGSAYFGARHDLNVDRFYGGSLDTVQLYDRALSSTEVSDLANQVNVATVSMTVNPCGDADSDGLLDCHEDANTDLDGDPSTNPGPDTDGDTTPNYLDNDDDGDGTPTASENADPNADGDPRDAVDGDRDGEPDWLDVEAGPSTTPIAAEQKISGTTGGLAALLDADDNLGRSVVAIGDLDGDGVNDLAVGAARDDDGGSDRGAVYVLFLNADGTVKSEQKISQTQGGLTATLKDNGYFGWSVAALGDLDGDGLGDIAVGARTDDGGGSTEGAVFVLFLNADGTVKSEQKVSSADGGLTATLATGDNFGSALAGPGDLDGDGIVDLVVGAEGDDGGGSTRGAVHVLFLNADGTVKSGQEISDTAGGFTATLDDSDKFGWSVGTIGDLDGDGVTDIAVGARYDDDGGINRGAVYVLFLNADGTVKSEQKVSSSTGGLDGPIADYDFLGSSVAGIGDVDGDGVEDLVVGAYGDDDGGTYTGAVYLWSMNADGTVKSDDKISATAGGLTGPLTGSPYFGNAVTGLGDLDRDGALNLAVGSFGNDDGASNAGAVYVLDLTPDTTVTVNSTGDATDAAPGNGVCDTGATNSEGDDECTLRAAIAEANASVAVDEVRFAVPASDTGNSGGVWTIAPATALPPITDDVTIDATTQSGSSASTAVAPAGLDGTLVVELDGSATGAGADGLDLRAVTTVRGIVVNGFPDQGIIVRSGADGSTIAGNFIGTNVAGTAALGNGNAGIRLDASSVTVGGTLPADRNLISGNTDGIYLQNPATDGNVIQGNLIGTNAAGTAAVANTDRGIQLESGADLNIIGGSPAAANVISGNGNDGIIISDGASPGTDTTGNVIRSNLIGLAADGVSPLGNGNAGVRFTSVTGNTVGGPGVTDGNRIAHNGGDGVESGNGAGDGNTILGNSIWANSGLGIDLGSGGPTGNDAGDGDTGANDLLNFPVLTAPSGGDAVVMAALDVPAGNYRIEVFTNPTGGADPSGHGEGESLLAIRSLTHTGSGVENFAVPVPAVAAGDVLTATTTEDQGAGAGPFASTSELSAAVVVAAAAPAELVPDDSVRRSDLRTDGGIDPAIDEVTGATGRAFDFDGFGDRLEGPALNLADSAVTLHARIRPDTLGGTSAIISKRDTGGNPIYELTVNGSGQALGTFSIGGGAVVVNGGSMSTGTWHDLVATWDGTDVVLYVDGAEVDRTAAPGALATEIDTNVVVGNRADGSAGFDGLIDHAEVTHDPLTANEVALRHANAVTGTLTVTVGQQQTGAPGPWAVTTAQSRSGGHALAAPTTAGSGTAAWAVANGIDEPGVVFESWWWVDQTTGVDLASGTRAGASATDQFDAAFLSGSDWSLRRRSGATTSTDGTGSFAPPTGAWVKVEQWTDQNGNSRLVVDGTEIVPWAGQTSPPASGSLGFRVGQLPGGQVWYVDDPRARRLISPEPVATLSSLDRD